jgi:hypothetical protein
MPGKHKVLSSNPVSPKKEKYVFFKLEQYVNFKMSTEGSSEYRIVG